MKPRPHLSLTSLALLGGVLVIANACVGDPPQIGTLPADGGCTAPLLECGGDCIDPRNDPDHCGGCDEACGDGQVCSGGQCDVTCGAGTTRCGSRCVDLQSDPENCGDCGDSCGDGEVCSAGACDGSCRQDLVLCGGRCIDPDADRSFCGASGDCAGDGAGEACAPGQVCSAGACATSCQPGLVLCDGRCIDPSTSRAFCGASGDCAGDGAGEACAPGQVCSAGACATSCQPGLVLCADRCIDPETDRAFCGASGDCTGDDSGEACTAGEICSGGSCVTSCAAPLLSCGGACVNPQTDSSHCGAAGSCTGAEAGAACGSGEACVGGECLRLHPCDVAGGAAGAGVNVSGPSGTLVEGGSPESYTVVLAAEPCTSVLVTVTGDAQVEVSPAVLVFTPETWDQPQTVTVTAVHDFEREGEHSGTVSHTVASGDPGYAGISAPAATLTIQDRAHLEHVTVPLAGDGADGDSTTAVVSDDGRWVAFVSDATNLVLGDLAGHRDVFLRDMELRTTLRISHGDGEEANNISTAVAITSDGERIAFVSRATNLGATVPGNGDLYVYARGEGSIELASKPCHPGAASCNNEFSAVAAISGDGDFVAYTTRRRIHPDDTDSEYDVYLTELETGDMLWGSTNSDGENSTAFWGHNAFNPRLSATGRYVSFNSAGHNLDSPPLTVQNAHAYMKDMVTGTTTRVSKHSSSNANCDGTHRATGSSAPFVSADGNLAVFQSSCPISLEPDAVPVTNATSNVFMRNITTRITERVGLAHDGAQPNDASFMLGMSDDARYVLFSSDANNLVPGDTNDERDLFLRDTVEGTTIRVGVGADYSEIEAGITTGSISRNGRFVVFVTRSNLADSDGNTDVLDIYRLQLW